MVDEAAERSTAPVPEARSPEFLEDAERHRWNVETRGPIDAAYIERRNPLWREEAFRPAFKPLDDARETMLRASAALATIDQEHAAGNLSDDQRPRLRQRVIDDARKANDDADRASKEALGALRKALPARAFATPPRGTHTAEAKADLRMRLDHRQDVAQAVSEAAAAAIASGDGLALRLLASSWGADYMAARGAEGGDDAIAEVRRQALEAPHLFPDDVRSVVSQVAKLDALDEAHMAGLSAVYTDLEGVETGRL